METKGVTVSCKGVTKSYGTGAGRVRALRGVDLEIRYGELLMLIGPSGSGKTTLLSIMAGLMDPDEGECLVLGHDLRHLDATDRTRMRGRFVGFIFQDFNLLTALTAAENVAVPLLINGVSRKEADAKARGLLDSVGVIGRADALPGQLSGGEQQRVAIARALVHAPKLVVCDEPTSNLDHATGRMVMELLRREARAPDRALVVVTHDARMFHFADRIAQMEDGTIGEVRSQGRTQEASL